MTFLRAIRLDPSDKYIYEAAAMPGEWAVPGSFTLWDVDPDRLSGKALEAFRHGFVGTTTFGWTTLVMTDEIAPWELEQVTQQLTRHLLAHYGAPSEQAAREVAEQEVVFTRELCEHPVGTYIAIERTNAESGIEERFRTVNQPDPLDHSGVKLWAWIDE